MVASGVSRELFPRSCRPVVFVISIVLATAGILVFSSAGPAISVASAEIRYTEPAAVGGACTEGSPCGLAEALAWSAAGDEIRLAADEYRLTSQLEINVPNLTISGPPGRYEPADFRAFLIFEAPATLGPNILVRADGLSLERVSVVGSAGGGNVMINATSSDGLKLDRVSVIDTGSSQTVVAQDAVIVNSIIRQDGGGYAAVGITGSILGSSITSNAGIAIVNDDSYHVPPDYCDLQILNTIAVGATRNLAASNGGSACAPNISYDYSWIPSAAGYGGGGVLPSPFITSGPTNLTDSPPALAAPFGGTFDLPLDSPAINTGCGGSCGIEDFYGRPRPIGAGNDIGATETILPPSISTVGIDSVTSGNAEVSATINPNGGVTSYNFQIRRTGESEWGSFSGGTTGQGADPELVRGSARPLDPLTSYEIRLTGVNASGVEETGSPVAAFTTPGVRITSARSRVTAGKVKVTTKVRTSGPGRVDLRATTGTSATRTWCQTRKRVPSSGNHTIVCNLGTRGRAKLRKAPLRLTLRAVLSTGSGQVSTAERRLTIKRRP